MPSQELLAGITNKYVSPYRASNSLYYLVLFVAYSLRSVNASRLLRKARAAPASLSPLRSALPRRERSGGSVSSNKYRNPSGSVLWQGQVNASHPCQRYAPCLAAFRSCRRPVFSPPILWASSRSGSFKRGSHSRPRAPVPRCPRPSPWFLACSGLAGVAGSNARPVSAPRFKGRGLVAHLACLVRFAHSPSLIGFARFARSA